MTSEDQRYAPPQADVEDVEIDQGGLRLAGRGRRFAASMIDLVAILVTLWLVSVLTPMNPWANTDRSLWSPSLADNLYGFLCFLGLQGWLLATRGQTIGKFLLNMRIARPDGTAASFGRIFGLRYGLGYLINIIPALGLTFAVLDALLIFRSSRRCLHDSIADTIVIKT